MGQQDGLRRLQMGLAGHDRRRMRGGLRRQRGDDVEHAVADGPHGVAQPHPEQRGDLVVAGPSGPQAPAEFVADPLDQPALERTVDVFVGGQRHEAAVGDVLAEAVQAGQ